MTKIPAPRCDSDCPQKPLHSTSIARTLHVAYSTRYLGTPCAGTSRHDKPFNTPCSGKLPDDCVLDGLDISVPWGMTFPDGAQQWHRRTKWRDEASTSVTSSLPYPGHAFPFVDVLLDSRAEVSA